MNTIWKVLICSGVLLVVLTTIEINTTEPICPQPPNDKRPSMPFPKCKGKGAVSKTLEEIATAADDFFCEVGKRIARLLDIWYWLEDYFWATWCVLVELSRIVFSWFKIVAGYLQEINESPNRGRYIFGAFSVWAIIISIYEYRTGKLTAALKTFNDDLVRQNREHDEAIEARSKTY